MGAIIAGSLGLSESSGKISHTVSHSFSNSFSIRGAGVGDVSWMKSQRSMSSISSLVLTSEISFVIVEGSCRNKNKGRGRDMLMCTRGFSEIFDWVTSK